MKHIFENYQSVVPENFRHNARVWIYQADRVFTPSEANEITEALDSFNHEWNSHGDKVASFVHLFFNWFIVLMADERVVHVGGCSTDASYRFLKGLERIHNVKLFGRHSLAFLVDDMIRTIPLTELQEVLEHGEITGDTLYFNNTILTGKDFVTNWIVPAGTTWLATRFKELTATPGN